MVSLFLFWPDRWCSRGLYGANPTKKIVRFRTGYKKLFPRIFFWLKESQRFSNSWEQQVIVFANMHAAWIPMIAFCTAVGTRHVSLSEALLVPVHIRLTKAEKQTWRWTQDVLKVMYRFIHVQKYSADSRGTNRQSCPWTNFQELHFHFRSQLF